jgi:hypothetical protein
VKELLESINQKIEVRHDQIDALAPKGRKTKKERDRLENEVTKLSLEHTLVANSIEGAELLKKYLQLQTSSGEQL